ncbi:MAG: multifunctional CCA tRNA nucleotidyl transferase/2'3'-cyclic phosphodiesterase/2'nucleotidase/phosphatase [Rhodoferax sp.]|nr:multifunctional CCA tRNA nucleotidyl transferase/2'3'-cyclic phosphodiesterase/2'nucleotidase/phosphatase [Rhodoferax sp.]
MHIYLVGGAVRDALLGLPVKDRDWVVVGATPEQLLAQGYLPVGRDFPVFLHPRTHEEYALARTERKTGPGYHGFVFHAAPDVSLQEDLARRDLTINAMAVAAHSLNPDGTLGADKNNIIDPWGGQADLAQRRFRHVTPAFREDPVRILRVARLAARFADFTLAPETLVLMREMVMAGEADHLVPERVWQELATGLMEARPSRLLEVLRDCAALVRLLPQVDLLWSAPPAGLALAPRRLQVLDLAARLAAPLPTRFACLLHGLSLPEQLPLPTACRELAELLRREQAGLQTCTELDAPGLVQLLQRCDAFRRPERLAQIALAGACLSLAEPADAHPAGQCLLAALAAAQSVDTATVSAQAQAAGAGGRDIGQAIYQARVAALKSPDPAVGSTNRPPPRQSPATRAL